MSGPKTELGVSIQQQPRPYCPKCGAQMWLRIPKPADDWFTFWGCSQYPECKGSLDINMHSGEPMEQERERG